MAERAKTEVEEYEPLEEERDDWDKDHPKPKKGRAQSYLKEHPAIKFGLVAFLLVLLVGGYLFWRHYSVRESTDDAQVDAHIAPVTARVQGTVIKVLVDNNQAVKAGDVLVQLDPKDFELAIQRAEADLANALANATAARAGVPFVGATTSSQLQAAEASFGATQKEVDAARSQAREAQANYNKVAADLARAKLLIAKDEISRQQYDSEVAAEQAARAALDTANSAIATAQARVSQARAQMDSQRTVPEQISISRAKAAAAGADVQSAQAKLNMAKMDLDYATVKAATDGIVSERNVEPGQVVQPGQPLVSIVDFDNIWITANFKETQLKKMRIGQVVEIAVDAYGRTYKGHVDSFGGATGSRFSVLPPENATGNFVKVVQRVPVKIVLEKGQDPEHLLRPGMSVNATVMLK